MEYSYVQYQADRKLLKFRGDAALPVTATLPLKLRKALAGSDAADHAVIQAAYDRLLAMAEAGPEMIPLPPAERAERPQASARNGPERIPDDDNRQTETADRPITDGRADREPPRDGMDDKLAKERRARFEREIALAKAAWQAALTSQEQRHKRRRAAYPSVDPNRTVVGRKR